MVDIVLLDSQRHRHLRIRTEAAAALGDDRRFVQVVLRELPLLVVHYPVFLSKDEATGAFFMGAMLGVDPGENLFLPGADGLESYRPLNLQRAPFFKSGDRLAIDLDSPRVDTHGETLFDAAGAPTDYLHGIATALDELHSGLKATELFVERLASLKLIEPIDIDLSFDDGESRELRDLYTIDRDALRALPDEAVLDLFRRGYLHLLSLMIASVKQVPLLAQRRNERLRTPSGLAGVHGR